MEGAKWRTSGQCERQRHRATAGAGETLGGDCLRIDYGYGL